MSLLEDVLTGALGKIAGGSVGSGSSGGGGLLSTLLPIIVGMLGSGGLNDILGKMRAQGLSAEADSWVGTGENKPITPEQAKGVVGADEVSKIASQLGISEGQTASLLADALPHLVDEVSTDGVEPPRDEVEKRLKGERRRRRRPSRERRSE